MVYFKFPEMVNRATEKHRTTVRNSMLVGFKYFMLSSCFGVFCFSSGLQRGSKRAEVKITTYYVLDLLRSTLSFMCGIYLFLLFFRISEDFITDLSSAVFGCRYVEFTSSFFYSFHTISNFSWSVTHPDIWIKMCWFSLQCFVQLLLFQYIWITVLRNFIFKDVLL